MNPRFFDLLITQTWQIAALAIVVAVIVRLVAKNRPHLAHAMWILVLIKCVTPPLWGHSLGVFSQLQATFAPDESAASPIEPATNVTPADVSVIQLSTPPMELSAVEDRSLEFDEPEDSVFDSEAGSSFEVVAFDKNDAVESDETLSAIAAVGTASSKPAADDIDYRSVLIALFCTGAVITLLVMIFRCLRCLRLIHRYRTTEFDESLSFRIQQLSQQLRIRHAPQVIVSNVLFGPAVLGFLRHTIVLPRCLFEIMEGDSSRSFLPERTVFGRSFLPERTVFGRSFLPERISAEGEPAFQSTPEQCQTLPIEPTSSARVAASREVLPGRQNLEFLDPILAHELIHIRRGDLRTGTLQAIVQSLWWFHPAVWFANRWLSREAERCCDEQVIAELCCTPGHYARSLLSVIESKHRLQPIPVFPGMRPVEITAQRMERIMSLKNGLKKRTPLWCWLMIAALAFVVLPGAVPRPSVDELVSEETNEDTQLPKGDDVRIQLAEFEGNVYWSDADLRKHLGERERIADIDNATALASDCESIESKYANSGFFFVEVTARTLPADNPRNRRVQFQIKEGRRHKVSEIRYGGNNRISASDLQKDSILKSGDMYDSHPTSKDVSRIRELYKELGLAAATINPVPHFGEESGICDFVFEIDEALKNDPADSSLSREAKPDPGIPAPIKTQFDVADLISKLTMDEDVDRSEAANMVKFMVDEAMNEANPVAVDATTVVMEKEQMIVHHPQKLATRLEKILHQIRTNGFAESELRVWIAIVPEDDAHQLLRKFVMRNANAKVVSGLTYHRTDGTIEQVNKIVFQPIEFCILNARETWDLNNKITENPKSAKFSCGSSLRVLNGETISIRRHLNAGAANLDDELPGGLLDLTVRPLNQRLFQLNMTIHADDSSGTWTCEATDNKTYVFRGQTRIRLSGERDTVLIGVSAGKYGQRQAEKQLVQENLFASNINQNDVAARSVDSQLTEASIQNKATDSMPLGIRASRALVRNWENRIRRIQEILAETDEESTDEVDKLKWQLKSLELQLQAAPQTLLPSESLKSPYRAASSETATSSRKARLILMTYPMADLVAYQRAMVTTAPQLSDSESQPYRFIDPVALALTSEPRAQATKNRASAGQADPVASPTKFESDFSPLVELIKATVQPETWDPRGKATMAIDRESLSLVIGQTDAAHDEIATLLSHLRDDQNANVRIQCRIVRLTNDSQITWLERQCSLHPLSPGSQWALLPQQRSEAFAQALSDQKPEVLFVPTVMTISGQMATIATGPSTAAETALSGIRLEITPHLLPESKVIRLQHSFSIGAFDDAMPEPIESLVGSGQTLLLFVNAPAENYKATAEQSHYLLMLTPEHVRLKEEEEKVVSPPPDDGANGTR